MAHATGPEIIDSTAALAGVRGSHLYNDDLAPVPPSGRKWGMASMASLWISMAACIPTYMLASGLIGSGMNWSQAVGTIFLGNIIVVIPMILNAHAGTRYGIPFPVFCRASFGTTGANIPALLRALVACGWFGIQTWIGGDAIYKILGVFYPTVTGGAPLPVLGITFTHFACFLFFWAINMWIIWRGIDTIRVLLNIKAPLLIALGLLLLGWAYQNAGGFGPILSQPSAFDPGQPKAGRFWSIFFPSLTGMIGFWATLSLNIPDFSRYAKSQRDQILGQALGLPATMALFSFIGVAVTPATTIIYGTTIWDPIDVLTRFKNPLVLVGSLVALCIATLATNIAARRPERLHLHLARRLQRAARPHRRHHDRRLLRLPEKAAQRPGALLDDRRIHLLRRFQLGGHHGPARRRAAEPARVSRQHQSDQRCAGAGLLHGTLQLCVARRLRHRLRGLPGAAQACTQRLNARHFPSATL